MSERSQHPQTSHGNGIQAIDWRSKRTWLLFVRYSGFLGFLCGVSLIIGYGITFGALQLNEPWQVDAVSWMIALFLAILALYASGKVLGLPSEKELTQRRDLPIPGRIIYVVMPIWFLLVSLASLAIVILFRFFSGIEIPFSSVPILALPVSAGWWKILPDILKCLSEES